MSPSTEDRELFFLLCTTGIQFLDRTYDVVPGNGFALRIVGLDGALLAYGLFQTEAEVVEELRHELEQAMYSYILGRHTAEPIWGTSNRG